MCIRIAEVECRPTVMRNSDLFGGCNDQFLSRFMLHLTEVFLMPGELVLQNGGMARELSFVKKGLCTVKDTKDVLIELISGEGTSPCVIGAVSFFLGMLATHRRTLSHAIQALAGQVRFCSGRD